MDATDGWSKLLTDEAELAGLPEMAIAAAKQQAEAKDKEGWMITLDFRPTSRSSPMRITVNCAAKSTKPLPPGHLIRAPTLANGITPR